MIAHKKKPNQTKFIDLFSTTLTRNLLSDISNSSLTLHKKENQLVFPWLFPNYSSFELFPQSLISKR